MKRPPGDRAYETAPRVLRGPFVERWEGRAEEALELAAQERP